MSGRVVLLTGASDGIGREAARALAAAGERVVLIGRDPARTAALAEELSAPHHLADFAELAQVRRLADELAEAHPRIDALVNNAGGSFAGGLRSVDGNEFTVQIDHLAPFLLTRLLLPGLMAARGSVIVTASRAADWGRVTERRLASQRFGPAWRAYGTAKLMNVMFAAELQRRHGAEGIAAVSFHPGVIATSFGRGGSRVFRLAYGSAGMRGRMATPQQGAAELLRLVHGRPGIEWPLGGFTERGAERSLPQAARDPRLLEALWDWSAERTGLGS